MDIAQFEQRKRDHLRHAMDPAHQATGLTGLDSIHLVHEALPDINLRDVTLSTKVFGRDLPTPFFVAGMTAGHADAPQVNRTLALACAKQGWVMGVGSQRRELEEISQGSESALVDRWQQLREEVPDLVVVGNIGVTQLVGTSTEVIAKLVHSIGASAIAIHANALQECFQPEGTPNFKGVIEGIRRLCHELSVPVVLKETGCGFSKRTLTKVADLGLAVVDVSGLGGTHWGRIEGQRALDEGSSRLGAASKTFAGWGESTVSSVLSAVSALSSKTEVWASGGMRTGLDAAKIIALGANRVGFAKPALEAALAGQEALENWMQLKEFELKTALFCTGCASVSELRESEGLWGISRI